MLTLLVFFVWAHYSGVNENIKHEIIGAFLLAAKGRGNA
jgi:hypothetical protein